MDKIRTFVEGLDDVLDGGIPVGHIVTVRGRPGTMKSTLTYNILHHNAAQLGIRGAYLSLEQGEANFTAHMSQLGYDRGSTRGKVQFLDLANIRTTMSGRLDESDFMSSFIEFLLMVHKKALLQLFVLDSLPVLEMMTLNGKDVREVLFHLLEFLRKELGVTAFIISEAGPRPSASDESVGFLSDGILQLDLVDTNQGLNQQLRLRCMKMRTSHHSREALSLTASAGSLHVTPVITDLG